MKGTALGLIALILAALYSLYYAIKMLLIGLGKVKHPMTGKKEPYGRWVKLGVVMIVLSSLFLAFYVLILLLGTGIL